MNPYKYTIVPEYNGTAMGSLSAAVTLTATTPDEKTSTIKADATTYVAGTDMLITVTLKDKNQATLKLSGWSDSSSSEKYAITLQDEAPESINTQVNAYTFTQTSEEGAFPTTGFTGATFTIVPKDGKSVTGYTWKSDASWVSVTDGMVKFTSTGTGDEVTITGTPTSGQGKIIKYSFTLKSWFINNGSSTSMESSTDARGYYLAWSGYNQSTVAQMSINSGYTATGYRSAVERMVLVVELHKRGILRQPLLVLGAE